MGWNHEGGLHFRDNLVSEISKNLFSTELISFFGRKILFSAELFFGRKHKRQIERGNNRTLDLRVEIWSAGYFFSGNIVSAERYFGRTIFRPNYLSAENLFGRKRFYIFATHRTKNVSKVLFANLLSRECSVSLLRSRSLLQG